ncbi:HAMP domain-containing histidine kinase [candidate division WOR-3 bacterium]|nr:HAMP domain-containing histidine kinase [candidate division WOR-3 bacterium]
MYRSLKGYLIFAGLAVLIAFLIYSQYTAKELEKEAATISRVYGRFCASATEDETSVIFDEIIAKINFPVIVTSQGGAIIAARNVKSADKATILRLDKMHTPVKIEYRDKILAFVHYGDSRARTLLKFAPFAEIFLGILFLAIGIIWFYTLKRSEENAIFAGIAKETAHQLGTPISSLMGWQELIKDKKIKDKFSEDLEHLSGVATKFHKIGNPPEFELQSVDNVIKEAVEYMRGRISKNVKIVENYLCDCEIRLDRELFFWAIENLIKNSVDAGSTEIKISSLKNKRLKINVEDNGKGVSKELRRKIFSPGYGSKEYGWGIGLSLSKRIIRMHHGKILYRPNPSRHGTGRENKGSLFTILLPFPDVNRDVPSAQK